MKTSKYPVYAASLTVEAALSFSLFLMFVLFLCMPMKYLQVHRKVQMAFEHVTEEVSHHASFPEEGEDYLSEVFLLGKAKVALDEVVGKDVKDLTIAEATIHKNREWIILSASYELQLPFPVFTGNKLSCKVVSKKRGWIGRKGGEGLERSETEDEVFVYVGESSTRYHTSSSCHYISNDMSTATIGAIETMRNKYGKRYRSCQFCKAGEAGDTAYYFPSGEVYHRNPDCSSIRFYVRMVALSQVSNLGTCSYCGKV